MTTSPSPSKKHTLKLFAGGFTLVAAAIFVGAGAWAGAAILSLGMLLSFPPNHPVLTRKGRIVLFTASVLIGLFVGVRGLNNRALPDALNPQMVPSTAGPLLDRRPEAPAGNGAGATPAVAADDEREMLGPLQELRAVIEGRASTKQYLFCASLASHWQEQTKYVLQGRDNPLVAGPDRALKVFANASLAGRLYGAAASSELGGTFQSARMQAEPELWSVLNQLPKGEGEAWMMWRSCEHGMAGLLDSGSVSQQDFDAAESAALTAVELAKNGVFR